LDSDRRGGNVTAAAARLACALRRAEAAAPQVQSSLLPCTLTRTHARARTHTHTHSHRHRQTPPIPPLCLAAPVRRPVVRVAGGPGRRGGAGRRLCVPACLRVCARVRVRACVCASACVRACVHVRVWRDLVPCTISLFVGRERERERERERDIWSLSVCHAPSLSL
jgi:hypothetical protein